MAKENLYSPTTIEEYNQVFTIPEHAKKTFVLNFWAPWVRQCTEQMNEIFSDLSHRYSNLIYVNVDAEQLSIVSERYKIEAVPAFMFLQQEENGECVVVDSVAGVNPQKLSKICDSWNKRASLFDGLPDLTSQPESESTRKAKLELRLKGLTKMAAVMLFMKGSPDAPECGFSRQIVKLLRDDLKVEFIHFNILKDQEVREGLKEYANWPTYPQLWVNGELVGGLDVVREMIAAGELQEMLNLSAAANNQEEAEQPQVADLETRLKSLINKNDVMIFIKGTPDEPECGFSRQLISLLDDLEVAYDYYDILTDEEVRQGLKTFSEWPTYPQVYVHGELVGGLDVVREMLDSGEFQEMIASM